MGIPSDTFALMVAVAIAGVVSALVWSNLGTVALLLVLGFYALFSLASEVVERLCPETLAEWLVIGMFWVPTLLFLVAALGM
jgi:hypothetical protein